jgi:hypothetical protein
MKKPREARVFVSRLTTLEGQGDRSFDLAFWQTTSGEERLRAAWELVELAHKIKGGDPDELRLQRSVEKLERRWG